MAGSATLTAVASSPATNDPMIAATRLSRLRRSSRTATRRNVPAGLQPAAIATTPASVTATPTSCTRVGRSCSSTRASTTVTAG